MHVDSGKDIILRLEVSSQEKRKGIVMFYISDAFKNDKFAVRDTRDNVVECYTRRQLEDIVSKTGIKILGIHLNRVNFRYQIRKIDRYYSSFEDFVESEFIKYLRKEDVREGYDLNFDEDRLSFSTRFIGWYDAWSGDEDVCDASILDKRVSSAISRVCSEFTKRTGIKVSWCTGEKAWSYFEFEP